jgi:ubiquinone/menaquinone biosynthesis C-methylase UbiE
VTYLENPEHIDLPDKSVDVVVSNTVFEHISTLGATVGELARILKPSGHVYTVFPLRSAILEQHAKLPLVHRIAGRSARLWYLKTAKALGFYRGAASPEAMEHYISKNCFYRTENEVRALFATKFASVESDAHTYIEFKARALENRNDIICKIIGRVLTKRASAIARLVHIRHSAAYCLSQPRH